ncbi:uncharacterized protein LOC110450441 [Mizuhopecten yessoensis]|uniref:uncharacterized protein LOC110450441 n=1 Tax=Mizuhopecten yessoensis TaxID=6573 RepID=UPI000B45E4FE|nr:uncharacterized protein LOC110450441 [Mizuhopecten yessoensis]
MSRSLELIVVLLVGSVTLCRGWRVVLKVASGEDVSPLTSLFDLWTSSHHLNDDAAGIAQVHDSFFSLGMPTYKSRIVNNWAKLNIQNVKVGMYDRNGKEIVNIVFNNSWSDSMTSWFTADNIVQQGQRYTDLSPQLISNCSAEGESGKGHRFLITSNSSPGCETIRGWMVVVDKGRTGQCHWDYGRETPFFLYSQNTTSTTLLEMVSASVFVIFVDDCVDNPCQFGGKCHNNLGVSSCVCADQYYGHTCETVCPCQYGSCVKETAGSRSNPRNFDIGGEILSCNCSAGYTGVNCDQDIDDCLGDPCLHGGVCEDGIQSYTCECPVGYHGVHCENTRDAQITDQSTTGAIIAVAVVVPLVVIVIVLAVIYGIYIKRNPDGYGRATIYKHSAIARDFVRRSFRRMSGRRPRQGKESASKETTKDNKKIISSEQITFEYDNTGFREGDVDDGFGDGDSSKQGYSRQDSEHIDLSPEDQSVISGESVRTKTPPHNVGYTKYLDPRQTNRSHSTSPRFDTEHAYPESSQDSNTSGSLYQEMNPGLTPDYGPAYQPDISPHYDNMSVQQKTTGAGSVESKRPQAAPRNDKDRHFQNAKPPSSDHFNQDVQRRPNNRNQADVPSPSSVSIKPDVVPHSHSNQGGNQRSNDHYNRDTQPAVRYTPQSRSVDRYNTENPPRSEDRYNPDIQPRSNREAQPGSDDRYNVPQSDDKNNASHQPRPARLDFNGDPRNKHPDRHTRGNHPSPGYSPGIPTSPGYARGNPTSPGYSPGNPTSPGYARGNSNSPGYSQGNPTAPPGYDRSNSRQSRTPHQESPPRGVVMLDDGEPIREINI